MCEWWEGGCDRACPLRSRKAAFRGWRLAWMRESHTGKCRTGWCQAASPSPCSWRALPARGGGCGTGCWTRSGSALRLYRCRQGAAAGFSEHVLGVYPAATYGALAAGVAAGATGAERPGGCLESGIRGQGRDSQEFMIADTGRVNRGNGPAPIAVARGERMPCAEYSCAHAPCKSGSSLFLQPMRRPVGSFLRRERSGHSGCSRCLRQGLCQFERPSLGASRARNRLAKRPGNGDFA